MVRINQVVKNQIQKAWHDRNIHQKILHPGSLVLLYDSKYLHHPGKLLMRWLGPFNVVYINEDGATNISTLQGHSLKGPINGSQLKVYYGP